MYYGTLLHKPSDIRICICMLKALEMREFISQVHKINTLHTDYYDGRLQVKATAHQCQPPITKYVVNNVRGFSDTMQS